MLETYNVEDVKENTKDFKKGTLRCGGCCILSAVVVETLETYILARECKRKYYL